MIILAILAQLLVGHVNTNDNAEDSRRSYAASSPGGGAII